MSAKEEASLSATDWYYQKDGGSFGPITFSNLKTLFETGEIPRETLVSAGSRAAQAQHLVQVLGLAPTGEVASGRAWYYEEAGARKGPVDERTVRDLARSGSLGHEALVWHESFGAEWRPLSASGLTSVVAGPPPLPVRRVSDGYAWVLAALPLAAYFGQKIAIENGAPYAEQPYAVGIAALFVNAVICIIDSKKIESSGRNARDLSLGWWFWLVPVYLFQRARVLAQPKWYFGAWLASFITSLALGSPEVLKGNIYWGLGTPNCDSAISLNKVRETFGEIPRVRVFGLTARTVNAPTQTSMEGRTRHCSARVTTSDGQSVGVSYRIEPKGDQYQFWVNLQ